MRPAAVVDEHVSVALQLVKPVAANDAAGEGGAVAGTAVQSCVVPSIGKSFIAAICAPLSAANNARVD